MLRQSFSHSPRISQVAKRCRGKRTSRGLSTVELLIALPILIMVTLGLIQFGTLFVNLQQLGVATRNGALTAAESALPNVNGAEVPANVIESITQQLATSGIVHCTIEVEHNVGGGQVVLRSTNGPCDCDELELLNPTPPRPYVRVSVCVPLPELMPDCLNAFGMCLPDRVYRFTTLMRHEL